ncbi:helix-turn-helix domain-containing protein [Paenibacillus yanchengensis]|uniref:Helix-turn-helix domain-containing protein n=1 Tax=Paenibacillus yanchengensis TaxID=2035833 RepID=A0ABW4YIC5_9BACL
MGTLQQWFYQRFIRSRLPIYFAIVVLLVIVLLIVPLYFTFSNNLRMQLVGINASLLSQIENQLDTMFKEMDRSSIKILEDKEVKQFIFLLKNDLYASEEEYQTALKKMYDKLASEEKIHGNLITMSLYIPDAQQVVMSKFTKLLADYEDRQLVEEIMASDLPSSGWLGKRLTESHYISGYPTEQEVFSFYRHLTNDGNVNDAMLLINIRLDRLSSLFNNLESEYPLAITIADEQKQLIYTQAKDMDINTYLEQDHPERHYFISKVQSRYNLWEYGVIVPRKWLFAPMQFITNVTLLLTIVVILFGIFVSMYLTKRFYRPFDVMLARLNEKLPTEQQQDTQGDQLQYAFSWMMEYTEQYGKIMQENYAVIKNKGLLDIVKGNKYVSQEYIKLRLDLTAEIFQVVSCHCDELNELTEHDKGLLVFAAVNIAEETVAYEGYQFESVFVNEISFALVFSGSYGYPEPNRFYELMDVLRQQLKLYLKYNWTIGVGNRYATFQQIATSYRESQTALHYRIVSGNGSLIRFSELQLFNELSLLEDEWIGLKDSIVQHIRAHDEQKAAAAIRLFGEWISKHAYLDECLNRIYYYYYSVFMELEAIIFDLNLNRETIIAQEFYATSMTNQSLTMMELEQLLLTSAAELIQSLSSQKQKTKSAFMEAIITYMETEYAAQHLSLESVAEQFNMNPSYFGQMIKKETNKTFLQYLSNVRITKAKELLDNHHLKIHEVAEATGYGNRSTFIRVFKAQVGITPTEYRNRFITGASGSEG